MSETISFIKNKLSPGKSQSIEPSMPIKNLQLYAGDNTGIQSSAVVALYYSVPDNRLVYNSGNGLTNVSDLIFVEAGAELPTTGIKNKLYIRIDNGALTFVVWDGTQYLTAAGGGGNISETVINQKINEAINNLNITNLIGNKTQVDFFPVAEDAIQNEFVLTHKPNDATAIRLYVNSMRYFAPAEFEYNETDNKVIWLFTEANGGFDINDANVAIEYEYKEQPQSQP